MPTRESITQISTNRKTDKNSYIEKLIKTVV